MKKITILLSTMLIASVTLNIKLAKYNNELLKKAEITLNIQEALEIWQQGYNQASKRAKAENIYFYIEPDKYFIDSSMAVRMIDNVLKIK